MMLSRDAGSMCSEAFRALFKRTLALSVGPLENLTEAEHDQFQDPIPRSRVTGLEPPLQRPLDSWEPHCGRS